MIKKISNQIIYLEFYREMKLLEFFIYGNSNLPICFYCGDVA